MADLLEKFDFTALDIRRSDQLLKEHPELVVHRDPNDSYRISIGPHDTLLHSVKNGNDLPQVNCTCALFAKKGSCHHLFVLLNKITSTVPAIQKQKTGPPKKKVQASLKKMVQVMDENALRSFVLQYSKKNKSFSFVLRAKLLRLNIQDDRIGNPYMELMNQLIHQRNHPSSALTQSQFVVFEQMVNVYLDEIEICKFTKDFLNDFQLTITLLDRINLVLFRTPKKQRNLMASWEQIHLHVEELLDRVDAPEFKDEIIRALIQLCSKSYYQFCSYTNNVVHSILKHNTDKNVLKNLGPALIEACKTKQDGPWLEHHYASVIRVLLETGEDVQFKDFCTHHIETPHRYLSISNILLQAEQQEWSRKLLFQGHLHLKNAGLHEAFIMAAMDKMSNNVLQTALLDHIILYQSIQPLVKILNIFPKFARTSFLRRISQSNDIKAGILPALYINLQAPKQLLKAVSKLSLDKLPKYDHLLWTNMPSKTTELYIVKIQAYMDQYLGDKALDFMRSIFTHLRSEAPKSEFLQLKIFIKDTYNHRSGIQKMVGEFQRTLF